MSTADVETTTPVDAQADALNELDQLCANWSANLHLQKIPGPAFRVRVLLPYWQNGMYHIKDITSVCATAFQLRTDDYRNGAIKLTKYDASLTEIAQHLSIRYPMAYFTRL